jgi:sugar lactone lactonase YvrE
MNLAVRQPPALGQYEAVEFTTIATGYSFAEAPRVDDDGTVYFSDLLGGGYYRCRPGKPVAPILPDRLWIGGAVLDASGSIVCGGKGGLVRLDPETCKVTPILSEIGGHPIVAVNDIEADARGGIFGGTVDFVAIFERGETPSNGVFFYLSPSGQVRVLREGLAASNGIGFSPDRRRLYHSESTRGIWVYPLGPDGMPGAPEMFAKLDDCDGLAVDSEGAVWVACWRSAELHRFRSDGTLERTVSLPFANLVSVAFGGADLHQLYVSTGDTADRKGGVVRIRVDVPGQREFKSKLGGP